MITTGKVYIQTYNIGENKFEELKSNTSGIYLVYNSGDIYSNTPSDKTYYSGLYIPYFKSEKMYTYPVMIGQLVRSVGPGINIGEWNLTDSPYTMRRTGDSGEIIVGEKNYLISGVDNAIFGHRNSAWKSKAIFINGTSNLVENSKYVIMNGATNTISGLYLVNLVGKNNVLYAANDIEGITAGKAGLFSGHESIKVTLVGDYNLLDSGVYRIDSFGDQNYFAKAQNILNFGNYNHAYITSGNNNLMVGRRNDLTRSIDGTLIGNENSSLLAQGDFVVGRSNSINISYYNNLFGSSNSIYSGERNLIVGNLNTNNSSYQNIFGNNNEIIGSDSLYNEVLGNNNTLSGIRSSVILGSSNSLDKNVLLDIGPTNLYQGNLVNASINYSGPFPVLIYGTYANRTGISNGNYLLGQNNGLFLNNDSYILGRSNQIVDNTDNYTLGKSNRLINNTNSYVFGYNNQITGSRDAIFVGFNFQSGNGTISGVGIKITPSGLDIYGSLRVNGVQLNIP
jgi:hypothetical protein